MILDAANQAVVIYGVAVFFSLAGLVFKFAAMHHPMARLFGTIIACFSIAVLSTLAFSLITALGFYRTLPMEWVIFLRFAIFTSAAFVGGYTFYKLKRI